MIFKISFSALTKQEIMKWMILLLFLSSFLSGCTLQERENALQKKEVELNEREQQLILREKAIQLKEEELAKLDVPKDSSLVDSSVYNPQIVGTWNVKMVCTETTCTGSAVGDTRNEVWQINYESNRVLAQARSGNQLVRIYNGIYTGNTLELVEDAQVSPSQPATRMVARLRITSDNKMEGQREILREGDCKIIYSMDMTKQ
jgi:hypothetical protein